MIDYDPKDAVTTWPEGDYAATLIGVEEKKSKAGNDMHVLTFKVYRGSQSTQVNEYVVYPTFTWKLKKLAQALGAEDAFKAGKFDPKEYIDRNLTVTLEIQEERDGYEERNQIKAFAPKSEAVTAPAQADDDDLPF